MNEVHALEVTHTAGAAELLCADSLTTANKDNEEPGWPPYAMRAQVIDAPEAQPLQSLESIEFEFRRSKSIVVRIRRHRFIFEEMLGIQRRRDGLKCQWRLVEVEAIGKVTSEAGGVGVGRRSSGRNIG